MGAPLLEPPVAEWRSPEEPNTRFRRSWTSDMALAKTGREVEVLFSDVPQSMQQEVISLSFAALEKGGAHHQEDQDIAKRIKEEFEKLQKQGGWHAIVGNSFGAQVSHEQSTLVALDISTPLPDAPYRRHKQILLYRHG